MTELTAAEFAKNFDIDATVNRNYDQEVDCICTLSGYRKYTHDYYGMTREESDVDFEIQHAAQNGKEDKGPIKRIAAPDQISRRITESGTESRKGIEVCNPVTQEHAYVLKRRIRNKGPAQASSAPSISSASSSIHGVSTVGYTDEPLPKRARHAAQMLKL